MPSQTSGEAERKSTTGSRLVRFVKKLGPYQSLALVLVPVSVIDR